MTFVKFELKFYIQLEQKAPILTKNQKEEGEQIIEDFRKLIDGLLNCYDPQKYKNIINSLLDFQEDYLGPEEEEEFEE